MCIQMLHAWQADKEATEWALGGGIQQAVQHWVSVQGRKRQLGALQELLLALRKRFKILRSSPKVKRFNQLQSTTIKLRMCVS